jgi:hypothetical protein
MNAPSGGIEMKRILAIAVVLAAVGALSATPSPQAGSPPANKPKPSDITDFLQRAITDGMTEDGVPPQFAAAIAKHDEDFLGKCVICVPIHDAIIAYGKLKERPKAKAGKGLEEDLVMRLSSEKADVRRAALRELVQRYVEREYVRLELSAEQKKTIQTELENMRKNSVGGLRDGQKFCPSCDGATCRVPKP